MDFSQWTKDAQHAFEAFEHGLGGLFGKPHSTNVLDVDENSHDAKTKFDALTDSENHNRIAEGKEHEAKTLIDSTKTDIDDARKDLKADETARD